jgi:hypothetical protein
METTVTDSGLRNAVKKGGENMKKTFRVFLGMLLVVMSFAALGSTAGAIDGSSGSSGSGFDPGDDNGNGRSCFGCRG